MRHADTPSGPGKPMRERHDAVTAQEEVDEMAADGGTSVDAGEDARHADRNAHANRDRDGAGDNASGGT
ncbi:MAG: hypothetical protein JO090_14825 [Rhizobacter sp.]|nr:hypothetical protein [Rhizobacter sp.]